MGPNLGTHKGTIILTIPQLPDGLRLRDEDGMPELWRVIVLNPALREVARKL